MAIKCSINGNDMTSALNKETVQAIAEAIQPPSLALQRHVKDVTLILTGKKVTPSMLIHIETTNEKGEVSTKDATVRDILELVEIAKRGTMRQKSAGKRGRKPSQEKAKLQSLDDLL